MIIFVSGQKITFLIYTLLDWIILKEKQNKRVFFLLKKKRKFSD